MVHTPEQNFEKLELFIKRVAQCKEFGVGFKLPSSVTYQLESLVEMAKEAERSLQELREQHDNNNSSS